MASEWTNADHGQATDSPHRLPHANLGMQSNVIVAGGNVNITVGNVSQDPALRTRKLIADWLLSISSVNSYQIHKDVSEKVMEGTGGWIFEQRRFIDWILKKKKILWGAGIPGAGKTCLTSIIINHLIKDRKAVPIYVYCQYKEQLSTPRILACLLRQAVLSSKEVATYVYDTLHKPCSDTNTTPSKSELLRTLHEALQLLDNIYMVIDALDELENNVRPELVNDLLSLQQPLLMTSRPLSDLPHTINNPDFTIRAQDKDIRKFVSSRINAIPQLQKYLQDPEVREEVVTKVQNKCQGMFLLAALQLDVLASGEVIDHHSLSEAIMQLPTTLNDQYELTWERIQGQGARARGLACRAIVMVTYATRILEVAELLEALTVDVNTASVDSKRRTTTETLVSVTFGLLMVETESNAVRPIHYTAQDFFESLKNPAFDNPHALLADISAIYMSQADIDYRSIESYFDLYRLGHKRAYPFISYAWSNLAHHAYQSLRYCNRHIPSRFSELTRNKHIIPMSLNRLLRDKMDYVQAIHFAAFHGLVSLFEEHQQEIHAKSSLGCSPLFYTCLGGRSALAEQIMSLLGPTLDFGTANHFGATALHAASQRGDMLVLARLLPKWYQTSSGSTGSVHRVLGCLPIPLNARMSDGQTALHLALHRGHTEAAEALLDCNVMLSAAGRNVILLDGSLNIAKWDDRADQWFISNTLMDVNAQDNQGNCPLHLAVKNGHETVVQLLLDSPNINVNAKDDIGSSPLLIAVRNRDEAIVRLLLDSTNIDVNAKDNKWHSPLLIAVRNEHEAVVQLLLSSRNIDVNAKDIYGSSPLVIAVKNKHVGVVRRLLNSANIDVNAEDLHGWSPLLIAVRNRDEAIFQLLLDAANINVNAKDRFGKTPLHSAVENGHETVVQLLLDSPNIDVNAKDENGRSPLHLAAENGQGVVVRLLLDSPNTNFNATDRSGKSPLHPAAENGHKAVVRLLLESTNIDVNAKSGDGRSPLHLAAGSGYEAVVRLLLDSPNIDINATDNKFGWSPLHGAAFWGREAVVQLLLGCSAIKTDVEAPVRRYYPSGTPLEIARKEGHQHVVKLFEEMGFGGIIRGDGVWGY